MLALRVPRVSPMEGFLESFLRTESLLSMGGLFPSFWLALPSCLQVVERDLIVGGAVGFHFFALLLPGNGDIASVPANVDDGAKVARGGVVEVASPLLVRLDCAVPAFGALRLMSLRRSFWMSSASSILMLSGNSIPIVMSTPSSSRSRS
jgi:hypothetical protein